MTDREIRKMLKQAYVSSETEKEKIFLRRYEKRSLQLMRIIKMESRYMGLRSVCAGLVLCVLLYALTRNHDPEMAWALASLIPIGALIPMMLLSRSERYGMDELEAVTRFSLRYIRIVRMFLVGIFSMLLLTVAGMVLQAASIGKSAEWMAFVTVPYLISTYGSMLVTRKWHSRDNIFGVLAVCLFSGMLPFAIRMASLSGLVTGQTTLLLIAVLLAAIFREAGLYVKESEDLSWN